MSKASTWDPGAAVNDMVDGFRKLPLAFWLANSDLKARFHRTVLGSLWSLVGQAIWVGSLAFAFSTLFNQDIRTFLPYIAVGIGLWTYLSTVIVEAPTIFVRNTGRIQCYRFPLTLYVNCYVATNLIQLAHYLVVAAAALLIVQSPVNLNTIMLVPALLIYVVYAYAIGIILGIVGARYRDVAPVAANVITLLFLLTPIFWTKSLVQENPWIADINPFYHLIEIGRDPLLGLPVDPIHWIVVLPLAAVLCVIAWFLMTAFRRSVFYWL